MRTVPLDNDFRANWVVLCSKTASHLKAALAEFDTCFPNLRFLPGKLKHRESSIWVFAEADEAIMWPLENEV